MKDSLLMHRKQKTSYEGYSLEGRVEPESKKKVPSEAKASTDETSSADSEYLLEKILYSRNILPALERVEKKAMISILAKNSAYHYSNIMNFSLTNLKNSFIIL